MIVRPEPFSGVPCQVIAMFQSLHIQGYRRFKDYRLENLARVNLLVGDNNSGKTSVLEAVQLLALSDAHAAFTAVAQRRGEEVYRSSDRSQDEGRWYPTVANCFSDYELEIGKSIRIKTADEALRLHIDLVEITEAKSHRLIGRLPGFMAVRFESNKDSNPLYFGIDIEGAFDSMTTWDPRKRERVPMILLDAELHSNQLRAMWDHVSAQNHHDLVVDALTNINDQIHRIHFDGVVWPPLNPRTAVKVGITDFPELVPIGSLGQGVYRMLELAIGLVASENGVFLIDEIDNGFHWTRMADIWKFVIETAKQTNTQVFATTHSEDCIKGLDWVCTQSPELAQEVSLQTLKENVDTAISLPGERLPEIMRAAIEVR